MPKEIKGMIRIAGTDIKGDVLLFVSLQKIKGISGVLANAICRIHNLEYNRKVGSLTEREIKKIENILENPSKFGIPTWMLNRRKDPETGEDQHLIGANLTFTQKQDVKKMMNMKTYRGVRHMFGLPVRGQRTRSSFRRGTTVGVVRKKSKPAKKKK